MPNTTQARRVLITGGTGFIGSTLVRAFSSAGHTVTFQYHTDHKTARQLEAEMNAKGIRIALGDLRELPDPAYDILINNAAVPAADAPVHESDLDNWLLTLSVNLTAPFVAIKSVLPSMIAARWGRIVNISSIYGLRAGVRRSAYVASKHGLSGLTKTVGKEYAAYGITCNEVCPGAINSPTVNRRIHQQAERTGRQPQEFLKQYVQDVPAGRLAEAEDIANAVLFLCSDSASYINGHSLIVDGGRIL
jgi:3-hydroxybutyrate dehydrogenase